MNTFKLSVVLAALIPNLIGASSASRIAPAPLSNPMQQAQGVNPMAAAAASAANPQGDNNAGINSQRALSSQSNRVAARPASPLTVSGNVAAHSAARGQSTHAAHYKEGFEEGTHDDGKAADDAKADAQLTASMLNKSIDEQGTKQKITKLISASLKHAKSLDKTITDVNIDETAKDTFVKAFKALIKKKYEKQRHEETLIVADELLKTKAEEIWQHKDDYKPKGCCSDGCVLA